MKEKFLLTYFDLNDYVNRYAWFKSEEELKSFIRNNYTFITDYEGIKINDYSEINLYYIDGRDNK